MMEGSNTGCRVLHVDQVQAGDAGADQVEAGDGGSGSE